MRCTVRSCQLADELCQSETFSGQERKDYCSLHRRHSSFLSDRASCAGVSPYSLIGTHLRIRRDVYREVTQRLTLGYNRANKANRGRAKPKKGYNTSEFSFPWSGNVGRPVSRPVGRGPEKAARAGERESPEEAGHGGGEGSHRGAGCWRRPAVRRK